MPRHGRPIYEVRAQGRIRWKVYLSVTKGGQRKQITRTFDSYEDAERFYAQNQLGDVVPRARDTFDDWAEQWLERKRDEGCRPITIAGYETDLKRSRAAFGRHRIQEVTDRQVEDIVRRMRDAGLSRRSSAKMLTTMRAVFEFALLKGVFALQPRQGRDADGPTLEGARRLDCIRA